jgi:hypothetical protein
MSVVTSTYDDDDDQPTLQRPPTGAAGGRAFTLPGATGEPMHGFGEETTAVDLVPLAETSPETTTTPAPPTFLTPADGEEPTPSLPLDVAQVLLRLTGNAEPPPLDGLDHEE